MGVRTIKLENSNWKFDSTVVPIFDEHVKQSVPMYEEIHNLIADIAAWFLNDDTNVYDIGTSTGKVIHSLLKTYPKKDIKYIGIDRSDDMCNKAEKSFRGYDNVHIINQDVSQDYIFENASLVTSVLTIQFIQQKYRQDLINRIYNGLNKGSGFIMVEKVVGSNARFNKIWTDLYHEMKLRNGLSEKHVFAKSRAIRGVLQPYTVDENIQMLQEAGFRDIDTFFKWNNFVGFIAIK